MDLEYTSSDELLELIRKINVNYYERLNANILYVEELSDRIYVVYIIELRDAYSHLIRVFDYDIHSQEGRKNVQFHLEKCISHLQRGLLDTFRKILSLELKSLLKSVHRNNIKVIEHQIAQEAYRLRVMDSNNTVDKRIEGYITLLDYMSDIWKKLVLSS